MADKKKSNSLGKGTSPAGIAVYPWLSKPDTKFNKDGEYRIKLKLEGEAATEMKAKLDKLHTTAVALMKAECEEKLDTPAKKKAFKMKIVDAPYKPVFDEEGNETDAIEVSFKQKATIKLKDGPKAIGPIPVFDAKGKAFKGSVYGGSRVKVSFEAFPYYGASIGGGLTLRLLAVQVLELVSGSGGQSASGYGFGEEDGFESDENTEAGSGTPAGGSDDDGDDEDF